MQSNRIVVMLAADGISGLDISYGKNINTMYLNSHLNSEFVVRPAFLLGASETMWVTFSKGETSTRPLLLAQRQTNDGNNSRQVVDGTESTIEKIPDTGYEYFIDMPDVVLQNVGEWSFSITITELPVDVEYKGQVNATSDLPSSGNAVGDTYWVGGSVNSYYYWNGSAWAVLNIVAVSTSDVGTITVNRSVGGQIGGIATDLDIQVLYNFVLRVLNRLSDYLPKIVDGYWWVWNSDSKAYVNSGEVASGLTYSGTVTAQTAPTVDGYASFDSSKFNRAPILGDSFNALVKYGDDTYICLFTMSQVGSPYLGKYVYVGATRGAQGEKGAQGADGKDGEKGEKGDAGATGVGIASVTEEVVTGGTKVTITLTNGTSSSFVVYNGTADNITNLEFPHGDAVVTYDNTDGLHVHGICRITLNGVNVDVPMDVEIPQTAGDGLTEDATDNAKGAVLKVDETVVRTNKANQTINGNVTIGGNVTIKGTVTSVSSENLKVKDKLIVVADGNTVTLTSPAGLLAPKYDGTNNGALVFDGTGTAYVGDVVLDSNGDIDVSKSDLQPLVTRGTLADGKLVKWNAAKLRLEDTGIAADQVATKADLGATSNFIYKLNYESATIPTIGQVLTLTNANFSRTPVVGDVFALMEVVNVNDTYYNNMEVLTVGDTTCTAKIMSFTDITSCKLTKVTEATTTQQAYVKNADGSQGMLDINNNATAQSIVLRDNAGRIYVKPGAEEGQAVNVKQMNEAIATAMEVGTSGLERTDNKVTAITGEGSDVQYPSTSAVVDYLKANAGTAYHVELTSPNGTLTKDQVDKLVADTDSYVLYTADGATYKLCRNIKNSNALAYSVVVWEQEYRVMITLATYEWQYSKVELQNVADKTSMIGTGDTISYPNTKAVYDADQATLTAAKSYADSILGAEQAWLQKIDSGEGV